MGHVALIPKPQESLLAILHGPQSYEAQDGELALPREANSKQYLPEWEPGFTGPVHEAGERSLHPHTILGSSGTLWFRCSNHSPSQPATTCATGLVSAPALPGRVTGFQRGWWRLNDFLSVSQTFPFTSSCKRCPPQIPRY
jgi:hypothetical protein